MEDPTDSNYVTDNLRATHLEPRVRSSMSDCTREALAELTYCCVCQRNHKINRLNNETKVCATCASRKLYPASAAAKNRWLSDHMAAPFNGALPRNWDEWRADDIAPAAFGDQRRRVKSQYALRDFTDDAIFEVNCLFR